MGSDLDLSTWAQSVLEPAGFDLTEFPSANDVERSDSTATELELREGSHSIYPALALFPNSVVSVLTAPP